MTDYVFIGRRRHLVRILIYGILTLGIYGRVILYRQVKDIDGHRALFIDVRVVKVLLVLPIIGPLSVKFKLRRLLKETVERDVTHPPVPTGLLAWLAFVPIIPAFPMLVQSHLNSYWRRQQKFEDIKHRRAELERLSKGRSTDEKKAAIKDLEAQIARREQALRDEEDAARAIHEAEEERRRAEEELKRLHKGPVARLAAKAKSAMPTRAAPADTATTDSDGPDEEEPSGVAARLRERFRRSPQEGGEESAEPERPKEPVVEGETKPGLASRLKALVPRRSEGDADDEKASRAERRAQKEERKAVEADQGGTKSAGKKASSAKKKGGSLKRRKKKE